MSQLLIQMSGVPGSGKSTIATAIAPAINAIILDHDDTKSAILSVGIENDLAGKASYETIKALASRLLASGQNVIIDSPCLYTELLDFGLSTAAIQGAIYKYIECQLDDLALLDQRLTQRESKPAQLRGATGKITHQGNQPRDAAEVISEWAANMKRPTSDYLVIDARQPIATCVKQALDYVGTTQAADTYSPYSTGKPDIAGTPK